MRKMLPIFLGITFIAAAQAAEPFAGDFKLPDQLTFTPRSHVILKFTLADDVEPPSESAVAEVIRDLKWRPTTLPSTIGVAAISLGTFHATGREVYADIQISTVPKSTTPSGTGDPTDSLIEKEFVQQLTDFVKSDNALSPAQHQDKLAALNDEVTKTERLYHNLMRISAASQDLNEMNNAVPDSTDIKKLQSELAKVIDQLRFKDVRNAAISRMIDEIRARDHERADTDPIAAELKKLVEFRERDVARMEGMVQNKAASANEVEEKKAAVAEARVRLLERQAAVGHSESLNKLSEELASLSVDLTELQMRRGDLRARLNIYRQATTDETALKELVEKKSAPSTQPALVDQLTHRLSSLRRERFKLQIADVQEAPTFGPGQ